MTHICNQRIKHGGKTYLAGEPIDLGDLKEDELPENAVRLNDMSSFVANAADATVKLQNALIDAAHGDTNAALRDAVAALPPAAFKKDGSPTAKTLKELSAHFETAIEAATVVQIRKGLDA